MNPLKNRSPPIQSHTINGQTVTLLQQKGLLKNLKSVLKLLTMKNQSINNVNGKAEFLDLKTAKNPFYQPLAGKANLNADQNIPGKNEPSKEESAADSNSGNVKGNTKSQNALSTVSPLTLPMEDKTEPKLFDGKPALNLESTLKLVEELHRRMVQRGRLVHTIDNLDKFEIEQKEDAEDTTLSYYQGCELEITDDKRNKFSTKNPVIIKAVALFVRDLCTKRLAEIEAEITLPA